MPAAVAVPLILGATSAGVSIYGGHKAGKAAEKASEQQQAGVREARAYAEPKYEAARQLAAEQHAQGRADLSPYATAGAGGIGALQAFLGVPTPPGARAATSASSAPPPPSPAPTMTPLSAVGRGAPSLEAPGRPPNAPGAPPSATQSSYVLLRAPSGETRPVPADQAAFFLARGATKV